MLIDNLNNSLYWDRVSGTNKVWTDDPKNWPWKSYPTDEMTTDIGVYIITVGGVDGKVFYVGQSKDLTNRLKSHVVIKNLISLNYDVASLYVNCIDKSDALELESYVIEHFRPQLNVAGK